jgi:hypothetical protein
MSVAARAASIVLRPAFDPLASDARSQDLLRRMGLPESKSRQMPAPLRPYGLSNILPKFSRMCARSVFPCGQRRPLGSIP